MGFEDRRGEARRDRALGSPAGFGSVPWITGPRESDRMRLRIKARAVLDGTEKYTPDEIQAILATMILSES